MEKSLFIVTHWTAEPSNKWEWRVFVVAGTAWEALREATHKYAYETTGQLHVSQVEPGEFIPERQP